MAILQFHGHSETTDPTFPYKRIKGQTLLSSGQASWPTITALRDKPSICSPGGFIPWPSDEFVVGQSVEDKWGTSREWILVLVIN